MPFGNAEGDMQDDRANGPPDTVAAVRNDRALSHTSPGLEQSVGRGQVRPGHRPADGQEPGAFSP